ncbi:MAG: GAF domain-containing protein [Candidatus Hodarchaeales archaeon]|jgi:PAS domain S-box-containing protein
MSSNVYSSLDYLPFSICIVNLEGSFIFVNKQMKEIFGYEANEFSNLQIRHLFPYNIMPPELTVLPEQLRYTEFQMIRKDGVIRAFGISINSLRSPFASDVSSLIPFRLIVFQDLAEIEKAKRQGLVEWLQYAQSNLALVLYRLSKIGPEVVLEVGTSIMKEKERALIKLGVFTAAAIGQGGDHTTGLFGPLPVPENENFLCLVFAVRLEDPTQTDPRAQGMRFCMINIVYPRTLESLFTDRRRIKIVMKEYLNSLNTIQELNQDILDQIGRSLIFFERETDVLKERTLEKKLNAIFELSKSLASTSDLETSFEAIALFAERTLMFRFFSALIVDRVNDELWIISHRGYQKDLKMIRIPIGSRKSIVAHVANTNQPLLISNVSECDFYLEVDSQAKSELAVPISSEGEVLGVLNVESEDLNAFTDEDESILTTLAERAASIIKRYELERQLRAVHELGHLIAHAMDYRESFEHIASFASRALYFKVFSIFEVLESGEMRVLAHRGYENFDMTELKINVDSSDYFVAHVARTGRPLYCDDIREAPNYTEADTEVSSEYALPINLFNPTTGRQKCVGVINAESIKPFKETDKFLFEVLANQVLIIMRLWKTTQNFPDIEDTENIL